VDLCHIISWSGDEVLDQVAALEYGDLRCLGTDTDRHQVATYRATIALATTTTIESLLIEIWSTATENRFDRTVGSTATGATALARLRLTAVLTFGLACVLSSATIAAAAITSATTSPASTATRTGTGLALSLAGRCFGCLGLLRIRRSGTNITDLRSLHERLFGGGRILGPVLRRALGQFYIADVR
jgi:hypothetical protein